MSEITTRALRIGYTDLFGSRYSIKVITEVAFRAGFTDSQTFFFRDKTISAFKLMDQVTRAVIANGTFISNNSGRSDRVKTTSSSSCFGVVDF